MTTDHPTPDHPFEGHEATQDRLRAALTAHTDAVEPRADGLTRIEEALVDDPGAPAFDPRWLAVAAAVVAVVLIGAALAFRGDDAKENVTTDSTLTQPSTPSTGDPDATSTTNPASTVTGSSPPTTAAPTTPTTEAPTTTPTTAPPALGVEEILSYGVVWPRPQTSRRFTDPQAAARSFATDFAGFADPVVGAFQAGDPNSGEVPVRAEVTIDHAEAITTVLVRRLADGTWWVIGSTNPDLVPEVPNARSTLVCDGTPVALSGTALAFEGHVNVRLSGFDPSGEARTLGESFVMGAGTPPAQPFHGSVPCESQGTSRSAVLSYFTLSAKDGSVWQFVALPVSLVVG